MTLRDQLAKATVPAAALVPVRFFAGITFLYAGIDKLLDPSFFDSASPASIYGQLHAFERVSPVAFLIRPMEPYALILGLLISLAEIAIGLGAITGLAFRIAAAGGAALSILFWLTASWATQPYFYGPDLPYAFAWVTLALAGTGGLFVPRWVRELGMPADDGWVSGTHGRPGWSRRTVPVPDISPQRRIILQAGALGVGALAVSSIAAPLRFALGARAGEDRGGTALDAATSPGAATLPVAGEPATTPTGSPDDSAPPSAAPLAGLAIARISDVDQAGAKRFHVPSAAPASMYPGDPGIIIKLADGSYAAYDATCTHEGCRVGWDKADNVLLCPCHGAAFDPSDHGAVLGGPTNQPLLELPLQIDQASGTISIKA
ncbi:MAG TPA: Rieske 2Fe-2S domain-containing protein [Candidatus Limnocylindrales bacterium]|jgi:thiosulfate dehydrogenase [quinone] large subunit